MVQTAEATDEASRCLKAPGAAADLGGLLFMALLTLCRCEAAAGDGSARPEHDLCLHLPPRHQEGPGAADQQLLYLF